MCWIKMDDRRCVTDASGECREGMTWVETDMSGWKILDDNVPMYRVTEDGRIVKRTDADIKRDKKAQGA